MFTTLNVAAVSCCYHDTMLLYCRVYLQISKSVARGCTGIVNSARRVILSTLIRRRAADSVFNNTRFSIKNRKKNHAEVFGKKYILKFSLQINVCRLVRTILYQSIGVYDFYFYFFIIFNCYFDYLRLLRTERILFCSDVVILFLVFYCRYLHGHR